MPLVNPDLIELAVEDREAFGQRLLRIIEKAHQRYSTNSRSSVAKRMSSSRLLSSLMFGSA